MAGRKLTGRLRIERGRTRLSRWFVQRFACTMSTIVVTGVPSISFAVDGWIPQASLSLGSTITDNATLSARGRETTDVMLRTAATIGLKRSTGRLKVNASYAPMVISYLNESQSDRLLNSLSGTASLEAIDNLLYVDARATIAQTFISPFAAQPSDVASSTSNRTEMRTIGLSPYVRGQIAGAGTYQLRHDVTFTTSSPGDFPDVITNRSSVQLAGEQGKLFVWSGDYSYSMTQFGSLPSYTNQVGRLRYTGYFDPEFIAYVSGGYEANDLVSRKDSGSIVGAGFTWQPNPRTKLNATTERRYFGNSVTVSASHQTRMSLWQLRASRGDQLLQDRLPQVSGASARAQLNELLQFTIPDPVARAQEVERLIQSGATGPGGQIAPIFTTRVNLVESIEPSVAFSGLRNTVTLSAFRRKTTPLSGALATTVGDPFSVVGSLQQTGWSLNDVWKLSEMTSVSAGLDRVRSTSIGGTLTGGAPIETSQQIYRAGLTHRVGPASSLNGTFRILRVDSPVNGDVVERSLLLTFTHNFYQ